MKKNISVIIGSVIIIIIIAIFYFVGSFQLFDISKKFLSRKSNLTTGEVFEVYYVNSGATSQNTIQVVKIEKNGNESIISNIQGYKHLVDFVLLPTSKAELILKKNSKSSIKDTVLISL